MKLEYYGKIAIFIIVLIIIFVLYKLTTRILVKQKQSEQEFFVKSAKKSSSYRLLKLYNTLSKTKLIGRYLNKWRMAYEMSVPGNTRENKEMAMRSVLLVWGIDLIAIIMAIGLRASYYQLGCIILTAYVVTNELGFKRFNQLETRITHDLDRFIDLVQFHFFNTRMVDEALLISLQETGSKYMQMHGQKIYDVLLETDDIEEAIKEYNLNINNYYVKAFAEAIFDTFIYGDKLNDENESKFVATLRSLKIDVREEQLSGRKLMDEFRMMVTVTILPIYFLRQVESVGAEGFASVSDLYHGSYGSFAMLGCFAVVFIAYQVIVRIRSFKRVEKDNVELLTQIYHFRSMKRMVNTLCYRNWGKTLKLRENLKKVGSNLNEFLFTTKKIVYFCLAFIISLILFNIIHVRNHKFYQTNMADLGSITSGASDEEALEMMYLGKYYVDKYKNTNIRIEYNKATKAGTEFFDDDVEEWFSQKVQGEIHSKGIKMSEVSAYQMTQQFLGNHDSTRLAIKALNGLSYEEAVNSSDSLVTNGYHYIQKILKKLEEPDVLANGPLNEKIANKVASKLRKVDREYFHWWEVIICFGIGVLFFYLPNIMMKVEKKAMQMDMDNEIIQFQTIILMLMDIPSMTTTKILERMLMFSRIFESSIRKCCNDIPLGEEDALEQLREDEPFEPFANIIECMSMSDRVGINEAFGGVAADRVNYQKKRQLEIEISIKNRISIKNFILTIPFSAIIILYMVAPIAIAAVGELTGAISEISTLG